jgi:glycosyltransferase involved in cell wall biosynthesis
MAGPRHPHGSEQIPSSTPMGPVLLVIDSLDGGGAERYVVDLAIALRKRGWPVEVACSTGGVRAGALADAGVPVRVLVGKLVKRRVSRRYERALRRLIEERRPALVHAHLYASAAAAAQATGDLPVPLVVTEHTEAPWRDPRARTVSQRVYRRADRVVAVSSAIRDLLVEEYEVPADRAEVVLPATTVPVADRRLAARSGALTGVVGRLVPEKGVDVFLSAAALVLAVVPPARFLVVGDGPMRADLEQRAAVLGIEEAVTFTGFRDDAPQVIAGLDVLVVPSRSDGSPLVVCEAMAAGIPVIASRVGGCRTWCGTGAPAYWSGPDRRRISHGPWSRCCSTRQRRRSWGAAGGTSRPRTRTATWSTAWRRCTAPWTDRPSPQADARAGPGPGPPAGSRREPARGVGRTVPFVQTPRKRLIAVRCWARLSGLRTPRPSVGARVSTPTLPACRLWCTSWAAWPTSAIG